MIAAHDPDHRLGLLERIAAGDFDALHSFGKVTDLPEDVASAIISALEEQVLDRVADAKSRSIKIGSRDPLQTLVLLNAWHPDVARWGACCTALAEPLVIGEYTVPAIELLGRLSGEIPQSVSERLREPLELQASRAPHDHEVRVFNPPADPQQPPSESQLTAAERTTSHSSRHFQRTRTPPCELRQPRPWRSGQVDLAHHRLCPNCSIRFSASPGPDSASR